MKDISIYFSPIDITGKWHDDQIGAKIVANNPPKNTTHKGVPAVKIKA